MDNIPSLSLPSLNLLDLGIGISPMVIQALFVLTALVTVAYTLMLFAHWRKHSPSPLKAFSYGIILTIGTGIFLVILLALVPMYSGLNS